MVFTAKNLQVKSCIVPEILPSLTVAAQLQERKNLGLSKFGALIQREVLSQLENNYLEVDISKELSLLSPGYSLEITVPALGICDLLKLPLAQEKYFPSLLAINGFGAKPSTELENNYPLPEFVLATDIMGNQFEIIVNADGTIEIPEDGTGLFSLIATITFIFSESQIIQGAGLEDFDFKKNKLLLRDPEKNAEPFEMQVCVTHINDRNLRMVNAIRSINVKYQHTYKESYNIKMLAEPSKELDKLNVSLTFRSKLPLCHLYPFVVCVTVDDERKFELASQEYISGLKNHHWLQDPIRTNVFTKHMGLSYQGFASLVRNVYPIYDFVKNCLVNDNLILQQKGYNNFMLMKDAFSRLYDLVVRDVVYHRLAGDFIFESCQKKLFSLDLSQLPANFHDSIVFSNIQSDLAEHHLDTLKSLFHLDEKAEIVENFSIFTHNFTGKIPQLMVDLLPNTLIGQNSPTLHEGFHKQRDLESITQDPPYDVDALFELQTTLPWTTPGQEIEEIANKTATLVKEGQFEENTSTKLQPFTVVKIDVSRKDMNHPPK
ncbi:MAG: hypothetical protein JSS07_05155 [Proteobacteria bacterium]|nr:hypothetical protein [Pseudomonadota bacterium]